MFTDTHLHLCDSKYDADRDAAIQRALAAQVTTLIEIAESPAAWEPAIRLAEKHPFVYASLGIHPHYAHQAGPAEWPALERTMRALLKHPKVAAVGECGLDYVRMQNTAEQQATLFHRQLTLAKEYGKPIVVHCRDAHADTQKMLKEFYPETSLVVERPDPVGVIHCFSGDWPDAQTYLMRGFFLGVDAPVTYPSSKKLQEIVTRLPLERLVLETDSPYLPPQTHRGQRNEPSHLPAIAEAVGSLKRKTRDEVAETTTRNARALFRLSQLGERPTSGVG